MIKIDSPKIRKQIREDHSKLHRKYNENQLYKLKSQLAEATGEEPEFGMFISGQGATEHAQDLFESTTVNVYNEFNQLIETTVGTSKVENTYNGEGLRVKKTVNGVETNYVYIYDKIMLELDQYGKEVARNISGLSLISRIMTS